MGFWDGLFGSGQRQPVFGAPEAGTGYSVSGYRSPSRIAEKLASVIVSDGRSHKIIPEVLITHCEAHISGSNMEVIARITNQSSLEIRLDKIVMLESTVRLDRFFAPGEVRKVRIYQEKVPTSDSSHIAKLHYKQVRGDVYFCADFTIKYSYDARGFYRIEELRPVYPIREI